MLAIQCIASVVLRAQGADAEWNTIEPQRGVDYTDYASVYEAARLLDMDADGRYQHRVVEVASAEESYGELEAENLDALEALDAWVEAGCPRGFAGGALLEALAKAGRARLDATPVRVAARSKTEAA